MNDIKKGGIEFDPEFQFWMNDFDIEDGYEPPPIIMPIIDKDLDQGDSFYKKIGKLQETLNAKQQSLISKTIYLAKIRFQQLALNIPEVRQLIYTEYIDRRYDKSTTPKRISKLAIDYNSSIKGLNEKIEKRIIKKIDKAMKIEGELAPWVKDWPNEKTKNKVFNLIIEAQLTPDIWFSPKIINLLKKNKSVYARRAITLWKGISNRQTRLVHGVLQALSELAYEASAPLAGNIISRSDAQQEAMFMAYRYSLFYNPFKQNEEYGPAKWSSYCYSAVKLGLKKFIAEKTRTVAVPRTKLDRYRIILNVIEETGWREPYILSLLANKYIVENKGSIKQKEIFTEEEVESILKLFTPITISLDSTFGVENGITISRPMIETLTDDTPSAEDYLIRQDMKRSLMSTLKEILSEQELLAISLKMGLDGHNDKTINECIEIWRSEKKESISKVKFTKLLKTGFSKLKTNKERLKEYHEVFSTIASPTTS